MVADAVESFAAEVERGESHVGAPLGVVVPTIDEWTECVFACVPAGAVAAVVAEGDGFGECHIEAECARDGRGNLGDFERVGEARALVVIGEHEDLRLAGETAERRGVENAITVAFEARTKCIGFLGPTACSSADGTRGVRREEVVFTVLAFVSRDEIVSAGGGM